MSHNPAFSQILDAFVSGFNAQNSAFAAEVNSQVAAHNAAKGEKVNAAKYFADSEDSAIKELLEKYDHAKRIIAQITEKLDDLMTADLEQNSGSAESAKAWLDENQKSIREFNSARRAIIKSIANFGMGDEEREYLENELVSVARPKGSAGNSGVKRPRFISITVNGDALDKPTLTNLAHTTKVSKDDIDKSLYAAAGVDDVADFEGDAISFVVTDNDGERFEVVAEPKNSAAPKATETVEVDESDEEDIEPTDEDIENVEDVFDDEDEDI